jgi:hypothetical protein
MELALFSRSGVLSVRIKQRLDNLKNASAENEGNEARDQPDWHGIYPKLWNQQKYHGQRCRCPDKSEHTVIRFDIVLRAYRLDRTPAFSLPQDPDHLFFVESTPLHLLLLFEQNSSYVTSTFWGSGQK